jgi:hypothetical protein
MLSPTQAYRVRKALAVLHTMLVRQMGGEADTSLCDGSCSSSWDGLAGVTVDSLGATSGQQNYKTKILNWRC